MSHKTTLAGALAGVGLGAPLLALMYLGWQAAGLPFAPFDLFGLVTRLLPGPVITAFIEVMVGTLQTLRLGPTAALAKFIEAGIALTLMLTALAALGALHGAAGHRLPGRPAARGGLTGLGLWALLLPIGLWAGWGTAGLAWTLALSLGWGVALGWILHGWTALETAPVDTARRAFLIQLGVGALALTAIGLGLGRLLKRPEAESTALPTRPVPTPGQPPGSFVPVADTRPELTPIADFYRVDITLSAVPVDPAAWALEVSGLVDAPLALSYADLTAMPSEDFYATLECISNRIAGDLISTTRFTGMPLRDVLNRAGLRPEAVDIKFTCADGYTESLPLDSSMDPGTRLCYAMDGAPLTPEHGFPARLFTPDRFGMKNPKWIVKIEVVGEDYLGYWEQRGWSEDAWVKTTSVIDVAQPSGSGALKVGGIAYAGARGISKVEVRVDGGEWIEAELKPALSDLTWVLWRAQVTATPGRHRLAARATDGTGALQTEQVSDVLPDGATGYHSVTVTIS